MIAVDGHELAKRLKERDVFAMSEIYRQYGGLLYSLVLRSVTDRGLAEDLLQEIFLRIWNRVHTFDADRGCFESWIVTVARNRAVDHLRAIRGRLNESALSLDDLDRAGWLVCRHTNAERIIRKMEIRTALRSLSVTQQEVLELAYFQGFTQTEIAVHLGKPVGTVKSLVRAALKLLRENSLRADVA